MRIRCIDLPGPPGAYIAFTNGLREMDDDAVEALAQNGMMLSLDPSYAEWLIEQGKRQADPAAARRSAA